MTGKLSFDKLVAGLLAVVLALLLAAGGLRWWTRTTLPDRRDVLDSLRLRPATLVEDAARMRPPVVSREFEIQAALADRIDSVTAATRSLLDAMEHGGGLPEEVDTDRILDALDLCFVKREDRHRRLEEWIVDRIETEPSDDPPAAGVYTEIEVNYFDTAHQAEAAGQPEHAVWLYARYLKLARRLFSRDVAFDTLDIQRRMTAAQVRVKILAPQHAFRSGTLEDLWHRPASAMDYIEDPDPGIRALALFTAAGQMYRTGSFADAIDLIGDRSAACGALHDECEFLMDKAAFQRAFRLAPPHMLAALAVASERFASLAARLPSGHYLKDDALLWVAIAAKESGDSALAVERLQNLLHVCPDTDRRSLVEELLDEYSR